ncbi:hypothetical protein [Streptomyces niveus]|uniref:hypothetical protein n=1 Tax=Streptomyces niveus TaxID=193462 RepID=UPI0036C6A257
MSLKSAAICAALAVLAIVASSCSTPDSDVPTPPQKSANAAKPSAKSDAEITLPLDSYILSEKQLLRISKGYGYTVEVCAQRFGLSFTPTPLSKNDTAPRNSRRYGITDHAVAKTLGYHADFSRKEKENAIKPGSDLDSVLSGKVRVFSGKAVPAGGCIGEAQELINRGTRELDTVDKAQELSRASYDLSMKEKPVVQGFGRWSQCMKEAGHTYLRPIDPFNDEKHSTSSISKAEIATASNDMACKDSTDVVQVWNTVETRIQNRLIKENQGELDAIRKDNLRRLTNAEAALKF